MAKKEKSKNKVWRFMVALYMAYSVTADILLLGGVVYLILGA